MFAKNGAADDTAPRVSVLVGMGIAKLAARAVAGVDNDFVENID